MVGSIKWEDRGPGWSEQKKTDRIPKTTRTRRAGGVAQAVEYLPSKHEAPGTKRIYFYLRLRYTNNFSLKQITLSVHEAIFIFSLSRSNRHNEIKHKLLHFPIFF
jgi:hypothetical protein